MKVQNISRLLLFREDGKKHLLTISELTKRYKISPAGTNFYYGINKTNVEDSSGGTLWVLNATHRRFFNDVLDSLKAATDDEYTISVGLEPGKEKDPYSFVMSNLDLVERLAVDLDRVQKMARSANKRLTIVVRYASEMNTVDRNTPYGSKDPSGYKRTFVPVRLTFKQHAPDILFSFSPALRADIDEAQISRYWPGDEYVDVIGGTWYIGAASDQVASTQTMRHYFINRVGKGKPFGLSEVGGCSGNVGHNDAVLQNMFHELEALAMHNVSFKFATIFLSVKWGKDATLSFLR